MTVFRWNPLHHAEDYRAAALKRRNDGGSTIRVYATSQAMHAARGGNLVPGTFAFTMSEMRAKWKGQKQDLQARDFRGDDWADFK